MDIHATFPSFFRAPKVSMKQKAPEKPAEVKGINVVEFKPEQLTGVIKTRTFDESVFVALATQYQVEGPNPVEMCDQNMRIAEKLRQMEIVQFWKIIKLFILADSATEGELENLSDEQDPLQKDSKKDQAVASLFRDEDSLQSGQGSIEECKPNFIFYYFLFSFSFSLPNHYNIILDLSAISRSDSTSISELQNGGHHPDFQSPDSSDEETQFLTGTTKGDLTSPRKLAGMSEPTYSEPQQQVVSADLSEIHHPEWDHSHVIKEMLEYFAEIGDVQMCVTVSLILKNKVKLTPRQEQQWFNSYIELLQRFRLWAQAATITSLCTVSEIRMLSQESTTIHTSCNSCRKPLMNQDHGFHMCAKCRNNVSKCALWLVSSPVLLFIS